MSHDIYAKLCQKPVPNYRWPDGNFQPTSTMEGVEPCAATTPLGMAIACPAAALKCLGCQNATSADCRTLYSSHNYMGSELHWLPPRFLQQWWSRSTLLFAASAGSPTLAANISRHLTTLDPSNLDWCGPEKRPQKPRPTTAKLQRRMFQECSVPMARRVDAIFQSFWNEEAAAAAARTNVVSTTIDDKANNKNMIGNNKDKIGKNNFGPIYASLPVQRVTILRDPFSWLMSKFFWHSDATRGHRCDDLQAATATATATAAAAGANKNYPTSDQQHLMGWATKFSLQYIFYLCGGDCILRFEANQTSLEELEAQAEFNLRHSFSVVGILEQQQQHGGGEEEFYDLVSTRVQFTNMSMNPHIIGKTHPGVPSNESRRCRALYQTDVAFRNSVRRSIPEFAALDRLYQVGLQVNRFQYQELANCPSSYLAGKVYGGKNE
jgi:hypothetical protein